MKVALLSGGISLERSVSLESGRRVAESLRELAPVHPRLDIGADGSVRRVVMPGDAGYDDAGPPQP